MYNWDFYADMEEFHPIADANNLYDGYKNSAKSGKWKKEVQRFRWNLTEELYKLQSELVNFINETDNAYTLSSYSKFEVHERGKTRAITALRFRDRIVKNVLNNLYLIPHIRPHLIYDNGASLKGKGVDFTRRRLIAHLESYYREYGTNEGYIRLTDFSGYYDNLDHELCMEMICKYEPDPVARKLVKQAYDSYRVDVSECTDEQYEILCNSKIKILNFRRYYHPEITGKKYLCKSLSVGDQTSQITAIGFPTPVDKMMTIVHGQKYYSRYMDDTYLIHRDKRELKLLGEIFDETAERYKLFINHNKTQIYKLSKGFTFMQYRYRLSETGHVIVKINKETVVRMRRKLKKLKKLGTPLYKAEEVFRSWMGNYAKVMSKVQRQNIVKLYRDLFGEGLDIWMKTKHLS